MRCLLLFPLSAYVFFRSCSPFYFVCVFFSLLPSWAWERWFFSSTSIAASKHCWLFFHQFGSKIHAYTSNFVKLITVSRTIPVQRPPSLPSLPYHFNPSAHIHAGTHMCCEIQINALLFNIVSNFQRRKKKQTQQSETTFCGLAQSLAATRNSESEH